MRVSERYELSRTQAELGFVDVDIRGDTPVFIDPHAIRVSPTEWAQQSVDLIRGFFAELLSVVGKGQTARANSLLAALREPNETHLGLSTGRARGRGMGRVLGGDLLEALAESKAVQSGLLVDLEDAALLVEGISYDRVSDIATNLIRAPLIAYTQEVARRYGIPLVEVASGPLWDPDDREWTDGQIVGLPRTRYGRLLLVPKVFVRQIPDYDIDQYFDDYVISYLSYRELSNPMSELIVLLKGQRHVYKKDLIERYAKGHKKEALVRITRDNPDVLRRFKKDRDRHPSPPLENEALSEIVGGLDLDCEGALERLKGVPPGRVHASDFEDAVQAVLACLFSPSLEFGEMHVAINERRKIVDISYQNWDGQDTFFQWLIQHDIPSMNVLVEAKNYSEDPENPEIDQLAGRFDEKWNRFGILVCPKIVNRKLMEQRCRDLAVKKGEYVFVLDYDDLRALLDAKKAGGSKAVGVLLVQRFNAITR